MINSGLLLVVVYTIRGDAFRLISARRATHQEANSLEGDLRRVLREELGNGTRD